MIHLKDDLKVATASILVAGFFAAATVNAANVATPVNKTAIVKPIANDFPWDCGGFCQKP